MYKCSKTAKCCDSPKSHVLQGPGRQNQNQRDVFGLEVKKKMADGRGRGPTLERVHTLMLQLGQEGDQGGNCLRKCWPEYWL